MLKKSIGLAAAALAMGVFGLMGNGCSSSSSSTTTTDGGGSDAKPPKEAGSGGDSGASAPACYADAGVSIPWGPATLHQNKCTPDQITTYFGLAFGGTDAADAGGAYQDWVLGNVPCATCIIGPLNSTTVPDAGTASGTPPAPVTFDGSTYSYINIAACLAAISGADATCQSSFANAQDTAQLDCEGCVAGDDANQTNTTACVNYDLNSGAASTSYPVDSTCATTVNGVSDADASSKCGISSSGTFEQGFIGIATAFCGQ